MWQYRITTNSDPSGTIYTVSNDVPPDQFAARLPVGTYVLSSTDLNPPATPVDPKPMQTPAQNWIAENVAPVANNGMAPRTPSPAAKAGGFIAVHKKLLISLAVAAAAWKWL